jgi:hypothetical protein
MAGFRHDEREATRADQGATSAEPWRRFSTAGPLLPIAAKCSPFHGEHHSDDAMKRLLCLWLAALILPVSAFDPIGPPPKSRTVEETKAFVAAVKIPLIDFDDQTTLSEAIDFIQLAFPHAYRVNILTPPGWENRKVPMKAKDVSILEAVQKIAGLLGADVKIGENVISLVPRAPAQN